MTTGVSFADKFQCINSKCPYNCCGGWQIEIDDETYQKYLQEEGAFGRELRRNMCVTNVAQIKQRFGKCPYLTKDKLCGMYLTHGEEYMSFACRTFPRRKIAYTEGEQIKKEELYLELSCPEAARLFLEEEGFFHLGEVNRKTDVCWQFEIEEEDYFEKLLLMRDTINGLLMREDILFTNCMMLAFDYAAECQQIAMHLQYDRIISSTEEFLMEENLNRKLTEYGSFEPSFSEKGNLIHKIISEGVENISVKWNNPGMSKLLKLYYRYFKNKNYSFVGRMIMEKQDRMLQKQHALDRKYRNYFMYYVSKRLLYAIQSYNMTKPVMMGIVHTQMLIVFDILVWMQEKESLSLEKQMEILAYYSRTAGHNESVCDKLYEYISKSKDMRMLLENYIL